MSTVATLPHVSTDSGRLPIHDRTVFAWFVAVSVATRYLFLRAPLLNIDEASYMVGARELLRGGLPYTTFADNKPPLIYLYYAGAALLTRHGITGVRLLTDLLTVPLTAYAAWIFYRRTRLALIAGLAYLVYSAAYLAHDMLAVNCEPIMLLPLAWALVIMRDPPDNDRRRTVFAGVLVGIATLVKYQAILWLPAFAAIVAFAQRSSLRDGIKRMATLGAGVAAPLVATTALFWALGGLDGFLYWNVAYNLAYVEVPNPTQQILWRAAVRFLPFVAATIVLWVGWIKSRGLEPSSHRRLLLDGAVAGSLVASFLGFRFFPHYFVQLYFPLALAAAPWLSTVIRWPIQRAGVAVIAYSAMVLVGFTVANARTSLQPGHFYEETNPVFAKIGDRLRADPCYGTGTLFVWGYGPPFYYYADLPVGSRLFFPEFPLVNYFPGNPAATRGGIHPDMRGRRLQWQWVMQDLRRSQPAFIVDTAPAGLYDWQRFPIHDYAWLDNFVRKRYEAAAAIDDVTIYRRVGCDEGKKKSS